MNQTKTQYRLTRQEAFQIMEWLKANRSTMEMETSANVIAAIIKAGLRTITHSVLIGMRKDLGWVDRRAFNQNGDAPKVSELEKRIEALEAFVKELQS